MLLAREGIACGLEVAGVAHFGHGVGGALAFEPCDVRVALGDAGVEGVEGGCEAQRVCGVKGVETLREGPEERCGGVLALWGWGRGRGLGARLRWVGMRLRIGPRLGLIGLGARLMCLQEWLRLGARQGRLGLDSWTRMMLV
jgi:hypothetical protein